MQLTLSRPDRARWFSFIWLLTTLVSAVCFAPRAQADTPDEQYQFAAGLYQQKLWQLAADKLREFVNANPNNKNAKSAAYMLGGALYRAQNTKGDIDYAAAAAAYERAITKYPDPKFSPVANFEMGDAYFNIKQYDKAIAAQKEFLKSNPAPAEAAQAQYWIGESYYAQQKPAEAKAAYQTVVRQYGDSDVAPFAQYSLGLIAADANQYADAITAFRAVTTKYGNSEVAAESRLRLADALLADKKYAEASRAYQEVVDDPKSAQWKADAELGLADAQFGAKDFATAATAYSRVLASLKADDNRRAAAQQRLSDSYYNAKDYEHALAGYKPLTQSTNAKTAGYALYFSGNALRELKRYPEAAAQYQKLLDNYPQHSLAAKAALHLGDAYAEAKNPKQAVLAYKLVLTKYQGSDAVKDAQQALTDLAGDVVSNVGNGGHDGVDASTAQEILHLLPPGPASSNAQLALAQAAFDKQSWSEAAKLAQAALDGSTDKGVTESALYLIGSAKLSAKDPAGAATAFRSLLAKNATGDIAGQGGLGLTWALLDLSKWDEAEAAARKVLAGGAKGDVKDRLQLSLGEALLRGKKSKEAATVFATLENSGTKDIAAQGAYGSSLALEADKQWGAAAKSWGKYAALAPDAPTRARAYLHQGLALVQAKSNVGAMAAFDQAVAADPKGEMGARALDESAWAAHDAKQTTEEAARWRRLITDFADSKDAAKYVADAAFQQGELQFGAKSWDDAAASYHIVTDKFPQSLQAPLAWYKLGSTLFNQKNWNDAAAAFAKAASFPKSEVALESSFWTGESYRRAGKLEAAKASYQTFISGATKPTAAKDIKAYLPTARLGFGQALVAANDVSGGIAAYEAGLADAQGADAAELNYRLGQALAQQGKYKEAYPHFLKVVINYGNSEWASHAQWDAGQALEKSGDKQAAIDMYRQLAQRQPVSDLTTQAQERLKALGAS